MHPALAALPLVLSVPASEPEPPAWTVLVYGAADNNADGPIQEFLDRLRVGLDDDPGVELVVFLDRAQGYSDEAHLFGEDFHGARLYRLRRDSAERLDPGSGFPALAGDDPEVDSADAGTLASFLAFGKARFPARRTALLIYSHADGEQMSPDDQSGREMGIAELSDVLPAAASVDFLALELCNMAGAEIAYQWRPRADAWGADVLLAIPNAGPPLDWARAFARLASPGHAPRAVPGEEVAGAAVDPAGVDAAAFGALIVEEGERGRRRMLARHPGGDGPYVDAFDLCRSIALCDVFDEAARAAAERAMEAIDGCVIASFGMDALEDFEPGASGLFVVAPRPDAPGKRANWRQFEWYRPDAGPAGGPYGRWAFLRDGSVEGNSRVETWFELLDLWYDDAGDDPGGFNGHRP